MPFVWLIERSLESTRRLGSSEGGDLGGLFGRVTVSFGLRMRPSCLYGSLHCFGCVWSVDEFNVKKKIKKSGNEIEVGLLMYFEVDRDKIAMVGVAKWEHIS